MGNIMIIKYIEIKILIRKFYGMKFYRGETVEKIYYNIVQEIGLSNLDQGKYLIKI